jgi:hypothetical protein
MASTARVPKLGRAKSRALTVFIFVNVLAGYVFGFLRMMSEYLAFVSATWIIVSVVNGTFRGELRALKPPPLFPQKDPAPGEELQRPEDDDLLEEV